LVLQHTPHLPHAVNCASGTPYRGEEKAIEPAEARYIEPLYQLPQGNYQRALRWPHEGPRQEHRVQNPMLIQGTL
jgi:hypothetical protein